MARSARLRALLLCGALLIPACARVGESSIVVAERTGEQSSPTPPQGTPATTTKPTATTTAAGPSFAGDYREYVEVALADIAGYWSTAFPQAYNDRNWIDLKGGVIAATPESRDLPSCGGLRGRYSEVQGNAYYCSDGQDYILYDDGDLIPQIAEEHGAAAVAVVLAHEFGHAVQFRARVRESSIIMEQQADCFAGSWVGHVMNDQPAGFTITADDINGILAALISVRDQPGTTASDAQAHGSGFDRASAFQQGFREGADACAKYPDEPPTVLQFPFTAGDFDTGGNLPFNEAITAMTDDLDKFWRVEFAAASTRWTNLAPGVTFDGQAPDGCSVADYGFCASAKAVVYNPSFLRKAYRIGDYAIGLLLASSWAEAALVTEGSTLKGVARSLRIDCYVGAWTQAQIPTGRPRTTTTSSPTTNPDERDLQLSAGDLDEGVIAFLTYGTTADGSAFERLAAFRTGLLQGRTACTAP